FRKVVIKSDNALLVDLIGNGYAADSNISEWRLIYDLCKKDWQLKFQHVPRDHDRLADCMDKVANSELNRLSLFVLYLLMLDPSLKMICTKCQLL
ncbi:hypothetical protein Golob_019706, partial [Gossypium lobatum]|nr:hypothetical protein [Gossypium lobatum]